MMRTLVVAILALFAFPAGAQTATPKPDVVLTGSVDGNDHQTYRGIPFEVPAGVTAITVEFAYSGRDERTTIDLGLADPERFRGASGGSKMRFTVAENYATPSYLPGPLISGTWRLLLGIPNIRKNAHSGYVAQIRFGRAGDAPRGLADAPLSVERRWYRGDFHAHSGHSDGNCASQSGKRVPCPLYKTVERATQSGLDFVTISEHNATSHYGAMIELQPYYDKLLLVPGRELTTFYGHANMFGPTGFVDYRVGGAAVPDVNTMFDQVAKLGGLVSVNHPTAPSGESCMGCGWIAPGTDWQRVQAIEAVNGGAVSAFKGAVETVLSGIPFWEALLNQGYRLTAIGGSDNHDVERDANAPGLPTTVVFAENLSVPAILEGVRSGRVFIDIEGTRDRLLKFAARSGKRTAEMGEILSIKAGARIAFTAHVTGAVNGTVEIIENGRSRTLEALLHVKGIDERLDFSFAPQQDTHWVRINVRNAEGKLVLIGNPIYIVR